MKSRILLVLAVVATAAFTACQKENASSDPKPILSASLDVQKFGSKGGPATLTIISSLNWTITCAEGWLKFDRMSGSGSTAAQTVTVTVEPNIGEDRPAEIRIDNGKLNMSMHISQEAGYDDDIPKLTISEFRAQKDDPNAWYRISGEIVSISKYEYGDLYLRDDTGYIYVYGLAPEKDGASEDFPTLQAEKDLKAGDQLTIIAHKITYNGIIETDKAYFDSKKDGKYPGFKADKAAAGWLELPATAEGDGLDYICHYDNEGNRNYSAYFDGTKRVSNWVCYPLFSSEKNDGRADSYAYDPLLPADVQADLTKSYQSRMIAGDEYVRGHMVPSYDRGGRRNLDLFLSTNIMPQSSGLNGGDWSSLESKSRDWAKKCDTLYVVVGADTREVLGYVKDNATPQKDIAVPSGIYRALLAYSADYGYRCIGFYFDNRKSAKEQRMSIDELEKLLGIDFFVNLPDDIENEIEAKKPDSDTFWK